MVAEIPQNHDVAGAKIGDKNADNILVEDFAVGDGINGHANCPSVPEERADDGPHIPVAVGRDVADAFAA